MSFHEEVVKLAAFVDNFAKLAKKKWMQEAFSKRKGRWEGKNLEDLIPMYKTLAKKEDKTKEETSKMRSLALAIRAKGGDVPGGKDKPGLADDG